MTDAEKIAAVLRWCDKVLAYGQGLQLSAVAKGDAGATVEAATFMLAQSQVRAIIEEKIP